MKHERGARGAAPAFDTATREGRRCPRVGPRPATCFFFFFSRLAMTCADAAQTQSDSRWIVPNRAVSAILGEIAETTDSGWNSKRKKEKKRCETHRLNLITNPKVCFSYILSRISLHPNPNFSSLILHPSSLCALCGVRSCWGKYQIVWENCVFPFSYSFGAQFHK